MFRGNDRYPQTGKNGYPAATSKRSWILRFSPQNSGAFSFRLMLQKPHKSAISGTIYETVYVAVEGWGMQGGREVREDNEICPEQDNEVYPGTGQNPGNADRMGISGVILCRLALKWL